MKDFERKNDKYFEAPGDGARLDRMSMSDEEVERYMAGFKEYVEYEDWITKVFKWVIKKCKLKEIK